MDLKKRLQEQISTQEKYSIILTILISVVYFGLYMTLGARHIVTMATLGLLALTIVVLLIIDFVEDFNAYSSNEKENTSRTGGNDGEENE